MYPLFSVVVGCALGCTTDPRSSPSPASRFRFADVDGSVTAREILATCSGGPESGCHADGAGQMHLPDPPTTNLVGVRAAERPDLFRVDPGRPYDSYLYLKVLGDGGIDGGRMPPDEPVLDPKLRQVLFDWIEAGAP